MSDLKFAVLGAGAMGAVFGARLAMGGADVTLLDVNQAHVDAVTSSGLRIDLDDGTQRLDLPIMRPEAYADSPDVVLLFTKVFHTDTALASISDVSCKTGSETRSALQSMSRKSAPFWA